MIGPWRGGCSDRLQPRSYRISSVRGLIRRTDDGIDQAACGCSDPNGDELVDQGIADLLRALIQPQGCQRWVGPHRKKLERSFPIDQENCVCSATGYPSPSEAAWMRKSYAKLLLIGHHASPCGYRSWTRVRSTTRNRTGLPVDTGCHMQPHRLHSSVMAGT